MASNLSSDAVGGTGDAGSQNPAQDNLNDQKLSSPINTETPLVSSSSKESPSAPSTSSTEAACPVSENKDTNEGDAVKRSSLGIIVDYPITPSSSEEEEMDSNNETVATEEQQNPVPTQDSTELESVTESTEQDAKEDLSKTEQEQDNRIEETDSQTVEKVNLKTDKPQADEGEDESCNKEIMQNIETQKEAKLSEDETKEQPDSNSPEEVIEPQNIPSELGNTNNSAKIVEGIDQSDKGEIDDIETASHGSAEFQPSLEEQEEGGSNEKPIIKDEEPVDKVSEVSEPEKCTLIDPKISEALDSMEVEEEESNMEEDVGTPMATFDVDEPVGTSTQPIDAEDGDSLLPETELGTKPTISKPRSFPITDAFMDENSLSLDCVLGMSSTVPEDGSMSMDNISKDFSTPAKRSRPGSVMSTVEPEDDDGAFPAENLFEYQWPLDGGEWYMLQEQISEYLQIKSFKRKYPDLYRRTCDKNEKDFLRERGVVSETQCDLGLTALRSEEVYDLMHKDYQERYREYAHVLHEKERQNISNKHKEYEVPKLDKRNMGAYIKKAVKAAADFNAQFQRERREERRAYFDLQTFMIQYPNGRHKKLPPEATKPGPYPVALIPGQYQNYYCKYTSPELKYLPLNTASFDPPKKMSNMLAKATSDADSSEVEDNTEDKPGSASEGESDGDGSSDSDGSDSDVEEDAKSKEEVLAVPLVEEKCRICNSVEAPPPEKKTPRRKKLKQEKTESDDQEMIKCSECGTVGHPNCLDLTNAMVSVIRTYPWQCMECKTCVECMDPYDEDKMMFCDRCDRGYHTFCVGLRSIPTGRWECRSCKGTDTPRARKRTSLAK